MKTPGVAFETTPRASTAEGVLRQGIASANVGEAIQRHPEPRGQKTARRPRAAGTSSQTMQSIRDRARSALCLATNSLTGTVLEHSKYDMLTWEDFVRLMLPLMVNWSAVNIACLF